MYLTAVHASPHEISEGKRRLFSKPEIIKQTYRDLGRNITAQHIVISKEIINFAHHLTVTPPYKMFKECCNAFTSLRMYNWVKKRHF